MLQALLFWIVDNLIFAALMLADEKMADKEGKYWRDYGHDFL